MNSTVDPPAVLAVALLLAGRQVLVVGAGPVAEAKIARLLSCGALLRVVAPVATAQVRAWADAARVAWHARPFAAADVDGCWLVVAATGTAADDAVFAACESRRILCNAADVPAACSVFLLSQTQLGPVTLATGTSGTAPGLAGRLRREARAGLPADVDQLVQAYAQARRWLIDVHAPAHPRQRMAVLRRLAVAPWSLFRLPRAELQAQLAAMYAQAAAPDAGA